eukprot:gene32548-17265_t
MYLRAVNSRFVQRRNQPVVGSRSNVPRLSGVVGLEVRTKNRNLAVSVSSASSPSEGVSTPPSISSDGAELPGALEAHAELASNAAEVPDESSAPTAVPAPKKKGGGLMKRTIFGTMIFGIGFSAILSGGLMYLAVTCLITYQATQEYFNFMASQGIAKGADPPSPLLNTLTTILSVSIPIVCFLYRDQGRSGAILSVASFLLLVMEVIAVRRPKFIRLASSLFGLFYCGWLPAFWVKVRMISTPGPALPLLDNLPGIQNTVGLFATFIFTLCVVAADVGAYFVGKNLGRTKLTDISPKKTVEGAIGGLASSVVVALGMWKLTHWPPTAVSAAALGILAFVCSLFGDLIESIMKRDAGMKDSGNLIPGHGGLLDRFDSYIFTGAAGYFFCLIVLPAMGL